MSEKHRIYLRLLEKTESDASDTERIAAVREAVERLGSVEWESNPMMHPRGGVQALFYLSKKPDFDEMISALDAAGLMPVI